MFSQLPGLLGQIQKQGPTKYRKFAQVTLNDIPISGLVDSGNNVCEVISEELYQQLGKPPLAPCSANVGTAKQGEGLEVLGVCKTPLHLHFLDSKLHFKIKPLVIKGFSMDFNISGPFLAKHKINQLHSRGVLQKGTSLIKLTNKPRFGPDVLNKQKRSYGMYTCHSVVVQPHSARGIKVFNSDLPRCTLLYQDERGVEYLIKTDKRGRTCVPVLNYGNDALEITKNRRQGTVNIISDKDLTSACHINAISPTPVSTPPSFTKRMTRKEKLELIHYHFKLNENKLLSKQELKAAENLFIKHFSVFSFNGEFGRTNIVEHEIHTTPRPPIKTKNRPLNPERTKQLKEQIDQWIKEEVIETSYSKCRGQFV